MTRLLPIVPLIGLTRQRTLLAAAALCLATGCPSEEAPTPTPDPTPAAADDDDDNGVRVPPWLIVELWSDRPDVLLDHVSRVSGYMRMGLVDVDPPFEDLSTLVFEGQANPAIKMLDLDGDGALDPTVDLDVSGLQAGDSPLALLTVRSSPGDLVRRLKVGVVAVDFLGNPVAQALDGETVDFGPGDVPVTVRVGPLDVADPTPPCLDGRDNDGDGWTDAADPDCTVGAALEAGFGTSGCNDGADNDGDNLVDGDDPDCADAGDLSELPGCEDGVDNDGDGWIDGADLDCDGGGPEQGLSDAACNNGVDDDRDGRVDALDPDCESSRGGGED